MSEVVDYYGEPEEPEREPDVVNAREKFEMLKHISQVWLDKLTPSEFMVVMFIFQRTYFWGKTVEFIKYRHFTEGIPNVIRPLPIRARRLQQIIKALEQKNIILREQKLYGSFYMLNSFHRPTKSAKRRSKRKQRLIS